MFVEGVRGHCPVCYIEAFVELLWTFVVQESLVMLAHSERLGTLVRQTKSLRRRPPISFSIL